MCVGGGGGGFGGGGGEEGGRNCAFKKLQDILTREAFYFCCKTKMLNGKKLET